jgi:hypothetical protein
MPQPGGRIRGLGTAADASTERGRWGLAPGSETAVVRRASGRGRVVWRAVDTSYRFPVVHVAAMKLASTRESRSIP